MDVKIKKFVIEQTVKTGGIEFQVNDNGSQLGDCYITQTGLTWCRGRTSKQNGIRLSWKELQALLETSETKKAALKAIK